MQTSFTDEQRADPKIVEAEAILRKCVHCGFCTSTCPTFVLLGDERDSPRGRIYMIKEMLENDRPADAEVTRHVDRCLSCLSCMTTCPSGVNYMHLVDHARAHIEKTYRRPFANRMIRAMLAFVLPSPARFRAALHLARLGRPFARFLEHVPALKPLSAMLALAPSSVPKRSRNSSPGVHVASGVRRKRVALLTGCAQAVLDPGINDATIALLTRLGVEVVVPTGETCCGSLVHHMGHEEAALASARQNVDAWMREMERAPLDAIVITASGCGTTIKDYGFMLRLDPAYAEKATRVSALAQDVTEFLATLELPEPKETPGLTVAYHSACSMQIGRAHV